MVHPWTWPSCDSDQVEGSIAGREIWPGGAAFRWRGGIKGVARGRFIARGKGVAV